MDTSIVAIILISYFILLLIISFISSKKRDNATFFTANRTSPWYLVAFGMIGTSLSGVTFISIPGEVGNTGWTYLMVVLGNCIGYIIIGLIILPIFYKLKSVSIYSWLGIRLGENARLTGSLFFMLSQLIGASFRLFLVVGVLQIAIFDSLHISFNVTVFITLCLVYFYTARGGIKTIVWTDALQTIFMLTSVGVTIYIVCRELGFDIPSAINSIKESSFTKVYDSDWRSGQNTWKQIISGIAITISINGLDQNMMQKNLTCRSLKDGKINMLSFSGLFMISNIIFLALGSLLYIYCETKGVAIPTKTDDLFPLLSLNYFGTFAGIIFLLGITAAAYSSVDSSLTSLTTSFCLDYLKLDINNNSTRRKKVNVHLTFSLIMFFVIILFHELNNGSVVTSVLKAVGYTYGPILGLFAFGAFSKRKANPRMIPIICILSPTLSYLLNLFSEYLFWGYKFGFEILIVNGLLCFMGLLLFSKKAS